jgi:hypothetical protein
MLHYFIPINRHFRTSVNPDILTMNAPFHCHFRTGGNPDILTANARPAVISAQAEIQYLSRAKHANISATRDKQTGFPPAR